MAALTFDEGADEVSTPGTVPDSPYLPMFDSLEDSDAAARNWNKAHPDATPVTPDTVTSKAGAVGRYQITPRLASGFGFDPSKLTDPAYNKMVGNVYAQDLERRYGDDYEKMAVEYDAGPDTVRRWIKAGRNDAVLPPETRAYVARARDWYAQNMSRALTFDDQPQGGAQSAALTFGEKQQAAPQKPAPSWWDTIASVGSGIVGGVKTAPQKLEQTAAGIMQWLGEMPQGEARAFGATMPGAEAQTIMQMRMDPDYAKHMQEPVSPELAAAGRDLFNRAQADIVANNPGLDKDTAKRYAFEVTSGAIGMIPALAATYVTKNPMIGATIIGGQSFADKYADARANGRSADQAQMDALFSGMANGTLGSLPLGVLMRPGGSFLAQTFRNAGAFGATSVAQEALQIGYDKGLVNPKMTLKEAWGRLEQAGIVGTLQGALLGAGHAGLESAVARYKARRAPQPTETQAPEKPTAEAPAASVRPNQGLNPRHAALVASMGMGPKPQAPAEAPQPTPPSADPVATAQSLQVARSLPAMPSEEAARPQSAGIEHRVIAPDEAVTSAGRRVPVNYAVVEAHHLVPSQTPNGDPNPAYPQDLQPRDRTRMMSVAQISDIARNLNPRLLGETYVAHDGAPIVSSSGVVESGNGRTLGVQQAYAQDLPSARAYREYLEARGYPVENMTAPMLVRIRQGDMSPADRIAFVREANEAGQLRYSATEQAMTDGARMPDGALDLFRGGDVGAAANRDFVRSFLSTVPETELGQLVDPDGALSQEGARRVQSALFAKAYGDPQLLRAVAESPDNNIRAIGGAMTDAAADWARMRARAADGRIPPGLDQTNKLLEAAKLVAQARRDGRNISEYLAQRSLFGGQTVDREVEMWLRNMFWDSGSAAKGFSRPVGRDTLADALRFYAQEAQKVGAGPDLLGNRPLEPTEILATAEARREQERARRRAQGGFAESPPLPYGKGVGAAGAVGAGRGVESSEAPGGPDAQATGGQGAPAQGGIEKGPFGPRLRIGFERGEEGVPTHLNTAFSLWRERLGTGTAPLDIARSAASFVHARGDAVGNESLVVYDPRTGAMHALTANKPRNVPFDGVTEAILGDPDANAVSFHNHPSSGAPSLADLVTKVQYPGYAWLVVVAKDGHWYGAKLVAAPDRVNLLPGQMRLGSVSGLSQAHKAAEDAIFGEIQAAVWRHELYPDQAHVVLTNVANRALDRIGLTHYLTSRAIPPKWAHLLEKATDAARKAHAPWSQWLKPAEVDAGAADRRSEPVRFDDGIRSILGGLGHDAGQPGEGPGASPRAGMARAQAGRPPVQLRLLEGAPGFAEIDAYHGSPETFDLFENEKIGTGEGAQSFGWGHYFASRRDVAEFYRDKLSRGNMPSDEALAWYFKPGRIVPSYGGRDRVVSFNDETARRGYKDWSVTVHAIDRDGNRVKGPEGYNRTHHTSPRLEDINAARKQEGLEPFRAGKLYTVKLSPDEHELLDWDKPFEEQSPQVREAIARLSSNVGDLAREGALRWKSGGEIYRYLTVDHAPAEKADWPRAYRFEGQPRASNALREAGVLGIRYLDQGSRGDGHGSHNYVIFDPEHITISRVEEEEDRFKTEPGAVDAKGNPLPQTVIPGAEGGQEGAARRAAYEKQVQIAKLQAATAKKMATKPQKEMGGDLFGPSKVHHPSLFKDFLRDETGTIDMTRLRDTTRALVAPLVSDMRMSVVPMAEGSPEARATTKDYANLMRAISDHAGQSMEALKKNFRPAARKAMWEKADEESVLRQQGRTPTEGEGLSGLTEAERAATRKEQREAQDTWNNMRDVGMVEGEGLPSWVPRLFVEVSDTGAKRLGSQDKTARSVPGLGGNVRTTSAHLMRRGYLTTAESEAAASKRFGTRAEVVKDIMTLPLAVMRVRQAVAGRQLINEIKEAGERLGQQTISEGAAPADAEHSWFTMQHPSFFKWRPKFVTDAETGKTVPAKDQNGDMVFEKVPLYVRGDFEGPLRAIMSKPEGAIYRGAMQLKARAMNNIMFSPLVQLHLLTELGRAFPSAPLRVVTGRILFEGYATKRDPAERMDAIMHGLAPTGHQGQNFDISSMADLPNVKPGRSWTSQVLGFVPKMIDPRAGEAVYRAADAIGNFLHGTLLWDRVADLQFGLYKTARDHLISKGFSPDTAKYMAAHWANRYAGTLPKEAMSSAARKVANIFLFSRTYTLGNAGIVKDMITGLPLDVQGQIARDGSADELQRAVNTSRAKNVGAVALDVALLTAAGSLMADIFAIASGRKDFDQVEKGYWDRLKALGALATKNPLLLANPIEDAERLSSGSENEIDPDTGQPLKRILVGYDKQGTAIYMRNPVGKFAEEIANWTEAPGATLKSKLSPFVKPAYDVLTNDKGFGRPLVGKDDSTIEAAAKIARHFVEAQLPMDQLNSIYNLLTGQARSTDAIKLLGHAAGVTFRRGYPGGPEAGKVMQLKKDYRDTLAEELPKVSEMIRSGDTRGAFVRLGELGITGRRRIEYIHGVQHPAAVSPRRQKAMSRAIEFHEGGQ